MRLRRGAMVAGVAALALLGAAPALLLSPRAAYADPTGVSGDAGNTVRGRLTLLRDLETQLSTDRTQYAPGRAVEIRLSLTNKGNNPQSVAVIHRTVYDIAIRNQRTGKVVWTWSRHQPRSDRGIMRMAPGQEVTGRELWDQKDDDGASVPSGVYIVEARFLGQSQLTTQIYLSDRGGDTGGGNNGGGGPRPPFPPDNTGEDSERGISSTLRTNTQRVSPGGTVNLTYTLTNNSRRPRTYRFSSGKQFDMEAVRVGRPGGGRDDDRNGPRPSQSVWRWSQGRMFTQMLGQFTLNPGESKSFTASWRIGNDVPPGAYDINAYLTPMSSGMGNSDRPFGGGNIASATARIFVGDNRN